MTDELDRAIRSLPRSIEPPPEVWSGIEARIEQSRRRRWIPAAMLAAAAAVAATVALQHRAEPSKAVGKAGAFAISLPELAAPPPSPEPAELIPAEAELRRATQDLARVYTQRRSLLDESLLAVLDANIQVVDDAIVRSRAALSERPGDEHLSGVLDHAYRKKLSLLRTAATTEPVP